MKEIYTIEDTTNGPKISKITDKDFESRNFSYFFESWKEAYSYLLERSKRGFKREKRMLRIIKSLKESDCE